LRIGKVLSSSDRCIVTRRLLIAEDDPAIASMVSDILRIEGYESVIVSEGRKVLDVLRSQPFDMVLLDVMLPGLDGISIMRDIRDEPQTSDIPVVMLTAKTDDESTWAGWRAGCNYYMTKPFDPDELLVILRSLAKATSTPGA
jgi:two-component system, OmpR family, response regulator MtrA